MKDGAQLMKNLRSKLKFIFLSNIKGHIEQRNFGSIFFNLKSPESFIHKIKKIY